MYKKSFLFYFLITSVLFFSLNAKAQKSEYVYFDFEPDIITNYITDSEEIGFIRMAISVQLTSKSDLDVLRYHEPLLRSVMLDVISRQELDDIKTKEQREKLRLHLKKILNKLLLKEANKRLIGDLLITKYMYQ